MIEPMDAEPTPTTTSTPRLAPLIQAYLFAEGGTLSLKKLSQLTNTDISRVTAALAELKESLSGTGLTIINSETNATLAVASEESDQLKVQYEKELGREVGDAGLEVLAILLYRGPSTRSGIDYIRGVNTSSTIRSLLARGLIERTENTTDSREYLYRPTLELLAHLGSQKVQDLPDYGTISNELGAFEEDTSPFRQPHDRNTTPNDESSTASGTPSHNG
jgi:segregation and condensation protein B